MDNFKAHILTASAGSGKTYSLAREYIYNTLKLQPDEELRGFNPYIYRTILAVTFTNKATEEMKSRILTRINELATGSDCEFLADLIAMTSLTEERLRERAMKVRSAILHDYSRFAILTNDTFFQRIVRAFVKELGIDINYSIELDTAPIIQKSVETLIERMDSNGELKEWLMEFAEENISEGKQWNIKRGIMRLKGELFKEHTKEAIDSIDREQIRRMVTHYLDTAQQQIDSVTAIARQAVELIHSSGYSHADFAYGFTAYFDSVATFDSQTKAPSPRILSHCTDSATDWFKKSPKPTAGMIALAEQLQPMLVQIVGSFQELQYLHNSSTLLRKNYRSFALLNDLYTAAKEICNEQNTMLLSETKHTIASFVTEQDAPFIYEKVGNRFEKFMIDEFQDTSLKEWENFRPLLMNAISQSAEVAVLLVGDIKQSIYRWRGSDWNILNTIAPSDLKSRNTPVLQDSLKGNYRSLPQIVEFNNKIISQVAQSENLLLNSTLDRALAEGSITEALHRELYDALQGAYSAENSEQIPKRKHKHEGYVSVTAHYSTEPDIVGKVRDIVYKQGFAPCDITILVRTRSEAESVAKVLLEAGIDDPAMRFGIMTQEALKLNSSPVVQFVLSVMRYAIDRKDVLSLAIYNRYQHNFNLYRRLSTDELSFFDSLKNCSPEQAFEKILIKYPEQFRGQSAYTDALHENIIKFCNSKVSDLSLFLKWWAENGSEKSVTIDKDRNAIEVMTIHKAKGLENKVIIIPYCDWRFLPDALRPTTIWTKAADKSGISQMLFPVQSTSAAANSIFAEGYYKEYVYSHIDAINLLYVALTRPKEQLHILFPVSHPDKKGNFDTTPSDVGQLLFNILDMKSQYTATTDGESLPEPIECIFGINQGPEEDKHKTESSMTLKELPQSEYKMKLKLSSRRFAQALSGGNLTPQDEGIILHGIMERARGVDDIIRSIEQLVIDGILSQAAAQEVASQVESVLQNEIVRSWFSDNWQSVRNECEIIVPKVGIKRPDRVMIDGNKAVVVDYKFGEKDNSYREQVALYCSLLEQMGYNTEGYLWYVREAEIEKVV